MLTKMMAHCQEPVYPVQISDLGCFYDEPDWNFKNDPVKGNCLFFETGFSELEEVLSRFQAGSGSGSEGNHVVHSADERKQRRKASNRESARRSRWRKKTHLENLTTELNRLKVQKHEFKNRFSTTLCLNQKVLRENDQLKAEALILWARFSNLSQTLLARQFLLSQGIALLR